jgi:hypothetical protein
MRVYKRKYYNIKAYDNEQYSMDVYDEKTRTSQTVYENNYETLYAKAKDEAKQGKICSIWELKYEVVP